MDEQREQDAAAQQEQHGEPLREEEVTAGDRLDDRVEEGEGLPESDDE